VAGPAEPDEWPTRRPVTLLDVSDISPTLRGLLHIDSLRAASDPSGDQINLPRAVGRYRQDQQSWFAPLLGPLVVPDVMLAEVGRIDPDADPLPVCVVNSTGAGGLVSLASREVPGVRVVAVESALRDLDDLVGNAARIVSAAAELDDSVDVYVEIPDGARYERAVEEVEAAGLNGAVRLEDDGRAAHQLLARQLSTLVEADLPFKVTGQGLGVLNMLVAVQILIETGSQRDAVEMLRTEQYVVAPTVVDWDEETGSRLRRRLRAVATGAAEENADLFDRVGLVSRP
jgi:hypothetical protein